MSARICGRSRILASTQKRVPAREPVALHVLVCSAMFSAFGARHPLGRFQSPLSCRWTKGSQ